MRPGWKMDTIWRQGEARMKAREGFRVGMSIRKTRMT
jgi:hypothetical protein